MNGLITYKAANLPAVTLTPAQQAYRDVVRNAVHAGLLGVGGGAGLRSLQGIYNMLRRARQPARTARMTSVVDIPVPGEDEKEAGFDDIVDIGLHPVRTAEDWWGGKGVDSWDDVPFGALPAVALGIGGTIGGWKGMDWLMDRARKRELKNQEQKARKEYEEALLAQSKVGEALDVELDELFDKTAERQRDEIVKAADVVGGVTNAYGLWALLGSVIPGIWMYEATKKRQRANLLEAARKKYRASREHMRPSPVYAKPVPVSSGSTMKSAPDEEELEGSPLDKAASRGLVLAFAGV